MSAVEFLRPRESLEIGSGEQFRIGTHAANTMRHGAMRSPAPPTDLPGHAAGTAAPKARRRDKHERSGMHVPSGQARPTRGGMSAREMSQTPPTQTAPVPFWRERTAQPIATPRGGSGGGKRPVRYMGWRPGETYDLSDVKHSERSINRPMTASADFIPPVEERAAIRGCLQKSSGYRGHIPRRFDVALTQPGGRGDIDQTYIRHHPGRVGHPDMPDTSLEPHVPSREHRTIEKDSSKLVHRVRPEVRHMFTETARAAPRGTREGVGMGYGGHVPKLFGGMKTSPGVNPSLLNGPGLCEQPRVDFEKSMRLGSHSALTARDEWQRIPSNKIAYDLSERNYTGKHIPSQPPKSARAFSPRFRGVGGSPESPRVGGTGSFGELGSPMKWGFDAKGGSSSRGKTVSISPAV